MLRNHIRIPYVTNCYFCLTGGLTVCENEAWRGNPIDQPVGRGDTRFRSVANFRAKLSILALSTMRGKSLFLFDNQAALATSKHFWSDYLLLTRPLN